MPQADQGDSPPGEADPRSGRRWPRVAAIVAAVLFVALLAFGLVTSGSSTAIDDSLARGEAAVAPGFSLPVLEGGELPRALGRQLNDAFSDGELGLDELRGTPILLNLWASWCTPCREEAPLLEEGWRRYGPRGVLFLGLDMQDLSEDAREFLREFSITYPTVREPANEVARRYGATGVPETFFIDAEGRVVAHVRGVLSSEQLEAGVAAARAGRVAGTLDGGDIRPQR